MLLVHFNGFQHWDRQWENPWLSDRSNAFHFQNAWNEDSCAGKTWGFCSGETEGCLLRRRTWVCMPKPSIRFGVVVLMLLLQRLLHTLSCLAVKGTLSRRMGTACEFHGLEIRIRYTCTSRPRDTNKSNRFYSFPSLTSALASSFVVFSSASSEIYGAHLPYDVPHGITLVIVLQLRQVDAACAPML